MSQQMRSTEIRAGFQEINDGRVFYLTDTLYDLPTKEWLLGEYWKWLQKGVLAPLGLANYTDNRWDCDDFSRMYAVAASICHKRNSKRATGLAVGEFWFRQDNGKLHSICVAFTDKGRIFIEPQSGVEVELSTKEIQQTWFVRF